MSIQTWLTHPNVWRRNAHSDTKRVDWFHRIPLLVKLVICICFFLALIVFGTLSIASTSTFPELYAPPQAYLPGNSLPQLPVDVQRFLYEASYASVRTDIDGRAFYLIYDTQTRMILRTSFRADEYTIGHLILAWGVPRGIKRQNSTIYVYWGTRSATINTTQIKPNSPIAFIVYDFEPQKALPWRGFMNKLPTPT
jgi:hypothetical protein